MRGKSGNRLRRNSALQLLEEQLKNGTKPEKVEGKTTTTMIPLTENDKKRINKEIDNLKKKLNKSSIE